MLEHIVIGIIYDKPLTGYDIKKTIEETIGMIYHASCGSLYPLLKKLAERELIEETTDKSSKEKSNGRIKIFYKSTAKGKKYFKSWLTEPIEQFDTFENELCKVYFFSKLTKQEQGKQLSSFENHISQFEKKLSQMHKSCLSKPESEHDYYKSSILYFGQMYTATIEKWCKIVEGQKDFTIK